MSAAAGDDGDRPEASYPAEDKDAGHWRSENLELHERLKFLSYRYRALEERVYRLESSVFFRFLRWLGPRLVRMGVPVPGSAKSEQDEYAAWAEESDLVERLSARGRSSFPPTSSAVTVLADMRGARQDFGQRMLKSLENQSHTNWKLILIAEADAPNWVRSANSGSGRRTEIVAVPDLSRCSGEFLYLVHPHAVLAPEALQDLTAAAEPEETAAVYSDWDHIGQDGRRYAPRLTPELSPELLEDTAYWGPCFLARTSVIRAVEWRADSHALAREIARHTAKIRRIPRVLCHFQESPATARVADTKLLSRGTKASIVICTRDAKRLEQSLKALRPTLTPEHEIVVVGHGRLGETGGIDKTVSRWGARVVPYNGPFHFGEMNRLGVEASKNEVLILLNDDVFPLASNWLDPMLAQAGRPEVGVAGALLLYPNRTIQHAGIVVGQRLNPAHIGRGAKGSGLWPWLRMTREVTAVTGACMTLRRSVWDELGGFDPQFPVNYNDVDLCLRAGERGYRVILEARAILIHKEAQTRIPVVRPEETEKFHRIWQRVIEQPDKYFNPQLDRFDDSIRLPPPWTGLR